MRNTCVICDAVLTSTRPDIKTCGVTCRSDLHRRKNAAREYTAKNIIVKEFATEGWDMASSLAHTYSRPLGWVTRSLEACQLAGVAPGYFIARYLRKDNSGLFDPEVDKISRELQIDAHRLGIAP